jgi:hypothetical protein
MIVGPLLVGLIIIIAMTVGLIIIGVMTVGPLIVRLIIVGVMTVGPMIVGLIIVGVMTVEPLILAKFDGPNYLYAINPQIWFIVSTWFYNIMHVILCIHKKRSEVVNPKKTVPTGCT